MRKRMWALINALLQLIPNDELATSFFINMINKSDVAEFYELDVTVNRMINLYRVQLGQAH